MPALGFCEGAAIGGHDNILDWAEQNGLLAQGRLELASCIGNLTMLQSLVPDGAPLQESLWRVTYHHDDLEAADWLQQQGVPMPRDAIKRAASCKAVNILWLAMDDEIAHGKPCLQEHWRLLLQLAVKNGDFLGSALLYLGKCHYFLGPYV